jgi:hypothetical protein
MFHVKLCILLHVKLPDVFMGAVPSPSLLRTEQRMKFTSGMIHVTADLVASTDMGE